MFSKVLIANRGEIAVRVARTCHELGVAVVAVHSDADAGARHVAVADEAVHVPGVAPGDTYLNIGAMLEAARSTGAEAIHPGYGFLSEQAEFAEAVTGAGFGWIGPPPDAARAAGDKVEARRLATSAGVPVVPGTSDPVAAVEEVLAFGREQGYPVAIKATGGGGGRGLRVVAGPSDAETAFESAGREARASFGSGAVYLERYLARPKHVEIQVLAPEPGRTMWLGARDCSLQRRHQKLLEETPPPRFADLIPAMGESAAAAADACGYVNAGTVEFLVDEDGRFYFLEINARLQVEHTITEEVLGIDLVAAQLRIAAGEPIGLGQEDILLGGRSAPRGHAIECRINAEDPVRGFLPAPGLITRYREPGGPGIRVDSGFGEGDEISPAYDSLIAKVVARAPTREEARRRMLRALAEFEIEGVATTIPAHLTLLRHPDVVDGSYTTRTVEVGALDRIAVASPSAGRGAPAGDGAEATAPTDGPSGPAVLLVDGTAARLWNPAIWGSVSAARRGPPTDRGSVVAPLHGTVLDVLVAAGDRVRSGDPIAVLESMKMETFVSAEKPGTVKDVLVRPGAAVEAGESIAVVE